MLHFATHIATQMILSGLAIIIFQTYCLIAQAFRVWNIYFCRLLRLIFAFWGKGAETAGLKARIALLCPVIIKVMIISKYLHILENKE